MKILKQYGISFRKMKIDGDRFIVCQQEVVNDLSYCLCGYFNTQPYKEFLEEELLIAMNKAIQGQPFDNDGGGDGVFLEVGYPNCVFKSGAGAYQVKSIIPTIVLKSISVAWVAFLDTYQ